MSQKDRQIDRQRAMMVAISCNDIDTVIMFVKDGYSLNFCTTYKRQYNGSNPLLLLYDPCLPSDVLPTISSCLDRMDRTYNNNCDLRLKEFTPLSYACCLNHEDIARYLVEHGAKINVMDEECKRLSSTCTFCEDSTFLPKQSVYFQPLWWACQHKNNSLVRFLLEHGADIEITYTHDRFTHFIQFACEVGNKEVVELLCQGLSLKHHPHLLLSACYTDQPEMVRLLLSYGANPKKSFYINQQERLHTCLSTLEHAYLKNHVETNFLCDNEHDNELTLSFYSDLVRIYTPKVRSVYGNPNRFQILEYIDDIETHISHDKEDVETMALLVHEGEDLSNIQCPLIREWIRKRVVELEILRIKQRTAVIESELLERAMHPDRLPWILDREQKRMEWKPVSDSEDEKQ